MVDRMIHRIMASLVLAGLVVACSSPTTSTRTSAQPAASLPFDPCAILTEVLSSRPDLGSGLVTTTSGNPCVAAGAARTITFTVVRVPGGSAAYEAERTRQPGSRVISVPVDNFSAPGSGVLHGHVDDAYFVLEISPRPSDDVLGAVAADLATELFSRLPAAR